MTRQSARAVAASISETSYHKAVHGERPGISKQLHDEAVLSITRAKDGGVAEQRQAGVAVCDVALRTRAGKAAAAEVLEALGIAGGAS